MKEFNNLHSRKYVDTQKWKYAPEKCDREIKKNQNIPRNE